MAESRLSKMKSVGEFIVKKNGYLGGHPGASVSKALKKTIERNIARGAAKPEYTCSHKGVKLGWGTHLDY